MRRSLALLFTSLLLVFALTACGGDKRNDGVNDGVNNATGNNGVTDNGVLDNGTAGNNATNGLNNGTGQGTLDSGVPGDPVLGDGVADGANPQSAVRGATYGQMLRNGRVHDTDGFLNDYENAVTPGTIY